jgi:hypothetical protein
MPVHTIVLLLSVALLALASARALAILFKYRGPRIIACPENGKHAGVKLDFHRVLATGMVATPRLQLSSCSRWPERAGCGQECLSQIEAAPEGCLVRTILREWFADKTCAFCGMPFGDIEWNARKPALLIGQVSTDCGSIPAERLSEVLQTARPVCFGCHMATTWVREHPDLTVDRSIKKQSGNR